MPQSVRTKQRPRLSRAKVAWVLFRRGFALSQRGNLWWHYDGRTLTVFARQDGWSFCIASEQGGTVFASKDYPDKEDALHALWEEVGQYAEW